MIKAGVLQNLGFPFFFKTKKQFASRPSVSRAGSVGKEAAGARFWVSVALIGANVILLGSYIYGVNDFTNKGYEIKTLQTKLAVLSDQNKQINLQVSEASSMVSIQSDFLSANFVAAGTPRFLQPTSQLTIR